MLSNKTQKISFIINMYDNKINDSIQGTPAKTGSPTPLICGENSGQHLYLDAGSYSSSNAKLKLLLTGSTSRKWKIKARNMIL